MKRFLSIAACVTLAAVALQAQPAAKTSTNSAGLGKQEAAANADLNIRAYIELLRSNLRDKKSEIMGVVMQLDAGQAAKFWPIYKEYEGEYSVLGDKVVAVVRDYADHYENMTDDVAEKLGTQVLNIEDQRNELKKKYFDRLKNAVGGITATRFLQVENQLERVMDLQVAAELPVMSGK